MPAAKAADEAKTLVKVRVTIDGDQKISTGEPFDPATNEYPKYREGDVFETTPEKAELFRRKLYTERV